MMKIAVTYENGNVFQHFGRTEQFKVYDIEDGKVTDAQVMDTNGNGHGALAGLLSEWNVRRDWRRSTECPRASRNSSLWRGIWKHG